MTERLTEITINGTTVTPGMELKLTKSPGRKEGFYRFDYAETTRDGDVILNVYGPVRARGKATPHFRLVNVNAVKAVHPVSE